MFYDFHIKTPKDTDADNKQRTPLRIAKGKIVQVSIMFPPGSIGLLYLRIFRGLNQLYPWNTDGYFQTSGESINYIDDYAIDTEPFELTAVTWNLDDTYEHGVHLRLNIIPFEPIEQEKPKENVLQSALRRLGF